MHLKGKGKLLLIMAALLILPTTLAACGKATSSAGSKSAAYTPKKLSVEFVPSSNAGTIEAKAKPLEGLLKKE